MSAPDRNEMSTAQENTMSDATTGHTPTPWAIIPQTQGGPIIAKPFETGNQMNPRGLRLVCQVLSRRSSLPEDDANAALIVRAVNSHAALVEALKRIADPFDSDTTDHLAKIASDALAKAK